MGDYRFARFRVASEFALSYLSPWNGAASAEADITIRRGKAQPLENPSPLNRWTSIDGHGGLFVEDPENFALRVISGRHVIADPANENYAALMHLRVLTLPLGFICYQLGAPPLHGALIDIDGTLLALCAPSGAGKSTLAAALLARGHAVLSDDLCVTEEAPDGGIHAYPGVGTLKLLPASIEALGLARDGMEPEGNGKLVLSNHTHLASAPRKLHAIVYLQPEAEELSLTRLPLSAAPAYLDRLYYRPYLAQGLQPKLIYTHALKLISAAPLYILRRPNDLSGLAAVTALLENFAKGMG